MLRRKKRKKRERRRRGVKKSLGVRIKGGELVI
jgi:hypothetical protein